MVRAFPQSFYPLKSIRHHSSDSEKSEKTLGSFLNKSYVPSLKSFIRKKPAVSLSLQHE
jgi:hypothetical protein